MFTGIIENTGIVNNVVNNGSNKSFFIQSILTPQLKVDQSLSHNGVCLTVEDIQNEEYKVTAIAETLLKTSLNNWKTGSIINLERCMQTNGRLDGHIVQGHVDCVAECTDVKLNGGSWQYDFIFPENFSALIIEKGSVAINGISLTCFNVGKHNFSVAVIPYTFHHTNINQLQKGDVVNIEFDVIGKYLMRIESLK
ncbi:MAG: riboflavin synthase [Ferruginibacter sp.]